MTTLEIHDLHVSVTGENFPAGQELDRNDVLTYGYNGDADAQRRAYVAYLGRRLEAPRPFVEPAEKLRVGAAA